MYIILGSFFPKENKLYQEFHADVTDLWFSNVQERPSGSSLKPCIVNRRLCVFLSASYMKITAIRWRHTHDPAEFIQCFVQDRLDRFVLCNRSSIIYWSLVTVIYNSKVSTGIKENHNQCLAMYL